MKEIGVILFKSKKKKKKDQPKKEEPPKMSKAKEADPRKRLTFSRVSAFLTCPMQEYYAYQVQDRGVQPIAPYIPFIEGEFLHYAMAHFHKAHRMQRKHLVTRMDRLIANLREDGLEPDLDDKLQVRLAAMVGACLGYRQRYLGDQHKYETVEVEAPFQFEIAGHVIEGVIDWLCRDKESDQLLLFEHKSTSKLSSSIYEAMPMNFQDLLYCEAVRQVTGEYPDARVRNYVVKTNLRRKKDKSGGVESLPSFEARVTQQYLDEPEKKFFRTPPVKVLKTTIKSVMEHLEQIITHMDNIQANPYMDFSSCLGKFDMPCKFMSACIAKLQRHADGWDAPECRGLYMLKDVLHPEVLAAKKGSQQVEKEIKADEKEEKA